MDISISTILTALFIISSLTNLTVEGIKKILDGSSKKYSSNVLAVIVSVVIALIVCVLYMLFNSIAFSLKAVIVIAVLMYLSFLVSTVGYDKVIQMIKQIQGSKE